MRDLPFWCSYLIAPESSHLCVVFLVKQADRLRRMRGIDEQANKKRPSHMSADDLADGFILDKDDRRLLSYKVRLRISEFSEV